MYRRTPVQIPIEVYLRKSGRWRVTFALLDYWSNPRVFRKLTEVTWELSRALNVGIDVLEEKKSSRG